MASGNGAEKCKFYDSFVLDPAVTNLVCMINCVRQMELLVQTKVFEFFRYFQREIYFAPYKAVYIFYQRIRK